MPSVSISHGWSADLPAGDKAYDPTKAVHYFPIVPEKQQRILGTKFRSMEETTKDTLEDFKARGWF